VAAAANLVAVAIDTADTQIPAITRRIHCSRAVEFFERSQPAQQTRSRIQRLAIRLEFSAALRSTAEMALPLRSRTVV
jgi:hypothetical protein